MPLKKLITSELITPPPVIIKLMLSPNKLSRISFRNFFLNALAKSGTTRFTLAHLSRHNNRPDLAFQTARAALTESGMLEGADYLLRVADPEDTRGVMIF